MQRVAASSVGENSTNGEYSPRVRLGAGEKSPLVEFSPADGEGCRLLLLSGPPGEQFFAGAVLAKWAFVDSAFQEERVGASHVTTRRDAESGHDLVAVQVRPHRLQFLLSRQLGDPALEVVVR